MSLRSRPLIPLDGRKSLPIAIEEVTTINTTKVAYENDQIRVEVFKESFNWVIQYGEPINGKLDVSCEKWYFTSIESMLIRLHVILSDRGLSGISFEDVIDANQKALHIVVNLAEHLERRINDIVADRMEEILSC